MATLKVMLLSIFGLLTLPSASHQMTSHTGSPEVRISLGRLQGLTTQVDASVAVDVFRGIPYAKPPVGPLRLRKPEPLTVAWSGVKNVTSDSRYCVDTVPVTGETEDCLYLDVYRPRYTTSASPTNSTTTSASPTNSTTTTTSNSSLPVVVWVHGGGWQHGSKNKFNGTLLAARGVIVVMINYRLGPLGFFSTEGDDIPGNFGMLDQVMALQWVQSNIGQFGGDPACVTLVGESAGSQATSLLLFSPLARGLFARSVMQSNVATELKFIPSPSAKVPFKEIATAAARIMGCHQPPGVGLLECLQNQTSRSFVNASMEASRNVSAGTANTFKPRIETTNGFLLDYPLRLLARGEFLQADTLRGFNSQENGKIWDPQNDGLTRKEFLTNAQKTMEKYPYVDTDTYVQKLEDLYLKNLTDPIEIRAKVIEMKTDLLRVLSIVRETNLMQKKNHNSSHFLYQFDYRPSYQKSPAWQGVLHAFNVPFEFGFPWIGRKHFHTTPTDEAVADMMMDMWVNFAKYGDPTPRGVLHQPLIKWKQFYPAKPWYLVIKEKLELQSFNSTRQTEKLALWERLENEYLRDIDGTPNVIG